MLDQLLKCKDNENNIELKNKLLSDLKFKKNQNNNDIDKNKEIQKNDNEFQRSIKFENDENIDDSNNKNKNDKDKEKEKEKKINSEIDNKMDEIKSNSEMFSSSSNIDDNKNDENSNSYYIKKFNLDNPNIKIKHLNNIKSKPKSTVKMRIFPEKQEPTTPKDLLKIIDNYKRLNKKKRDDYNRYKTKYSVYAIDTSNINMLINSNKSSSQNLKEKLKISNPPLSYNEIIKALQK